MAHATTISSSSTSPSIELPQCKLIDELRSKVEEKVREKAEKIIKS
jgi:hypothetical protein